MSAKSDREPSNEAAGGREAFLYAQSPRPAGLPVTFRIRGRALEVERMARADRFPLDRVEVVQLTFETRSFAPAQLTAKLTFEGGRTVKITSVDFRSLVDARRRDAEYGRFMRELIARIGRYSPKARFMAGRSWPVWAITAIFAVAIVFGLAIIALQAWRQGEAVVALGAIAVAGLGIWQLEPLVRHNKPRRFTPDAPPETLVPNLPLPEGAPR